ncbi:MAG TPA: DUF4411 family protein [Dehalococcoidia bacterium]|nr:DUF4411 family protein [Dehalococcoidia bacterium]
MASTTWVIDTSSLIAVRSLFSRGDQSAIMDGLSNLVTEGRVVFPREVVTELERYEGKDVPALVWAKTHQGLATQKQPSFDSVREVLEQVPEVVDPDKEGVEEADPYVLAMAREMLNDGVDVRVVTEEFKTTNAKMNLGSAAGFLRIPSVSIKAMLKFEGIREF